MEKKDKEFNPVEFKKLVRKKGTRWLTAAYIYLEYDEEKISRELDKLLSDKYIEKRVTDLWSRLRKRNEDMLIKEYAKEDIIFNELVRKLKRSQQLDEWLKRVATHAERSEEERERAVTRLELVRIESEGAAETEPEQDASYMTSDSEGRTSREIRKPQIRAFNVIAGKPMKIVLNIRSGIAPFLARCYVVRKATEEEIRRSSESQAEQADENRTTSMLRIDNKFQEIIRNTNEEFSFNIPEKAAGEYYIHAIATGHLKEKEKSPTEKDIIITSSMKEEISRLVIKIKAMPAAIEIINPPERSVLEIGRQVENLQVRYSGNIEEFYLAWIIEKENSAVPQQIIHIGKGILGLGRSRYAINEAFEQGKAFLKFEARHSETSGAFAASQIEIHLTKHPRQLEALSEIENALDNIERIAKGERAEPEGGQPAGTPPAGEEPLYEVLPDEEPQEERASPGEADNTEGARLLDSLIVEEGGITLREWLSQDDEGRQALIRKVKETKPAQEFVRYCEELFANVEAHRIDEASIDFKIAKSCAYAIKSILWYYKIDPEKACELVYEAIQAL